MMHPRVMKIMAKIKCYIPEEAIEARKELYIVVVMVDVVGMIDHNKISGYHTMLEILMVMRLKEVEVEVIVVQEVIGNN